MDDDVIRKRLTDRLWTWDIVNADSIAEMALPVVRDLMDAAAAEELRKAAADLDRRCDACSHPDGLR